MSFPSVPKDQLGDYQLVRLIHETDDTQTFEATQVTVDRTVALVILKSHRCMDPAAANLFRAEIRAKASVSHPRIAAVYESSEADGLIYYTREVVFGKDLEELITAGTYLSPSKVLDLARVTADTFLYYQSSGINHRSITPQALVLINDEPYVANLATAEPSETDAFTESMETLYQWLPQLLDPSQPLSHDLSAFFARMHPEHPRHYRDWRDVQRACNILSNLLTPTLSSYQENLGPSAQELMAETLKRTQIQNRILVSFAVLLLIGIIGAIAHFTYFKGPNARPLDQMVVIPAGPFVYQQNDTRETPQFSISKYEVTIADYAKFLKALETTSPTVFQHPDQPASKTSYEPENWDVYYPIAKKGGIYRGNPLDVNCPVFLVDWWDANAYVRWKGHRLPSSEEWEKAARGEHGNLFPWGDESNPPNVNSGSDYREITEQGGYLDGYNGWAPVDALATDLSDFGVVGMGGNVSEWTMDFDTHPEFPDREIPVVMGASFLNPENLELDFRRLREPDGRYVSIGFRTVKDG